MDVDITAESKRRLAALLVVVSDLHVGSSLAISPASFELSTGTMFSPARVQRVLNELWGELWGKVFKQAAKRPVYVVFDGDLIEGGHRGRQHAVETWAIRPKDQIDAAVQLFTPIAQKAKKVFVTSGTPFHVEDYGNCEDWIAKEIGAHALKTFRRPRLHINGRVFEFAHKGVKFGSRLWTWENTLRQHVKNNMLNCLLAQERPADVYTYSHYHRFVDTGDVTLHTRDGLRHVSRGVITPAWKTIDEWTNHTESPLSDIGMVIWEIDEDSTLRLQAPILHLDPAEDIHV